MRYSELTILDGGLRKHRFHDREIVKDGERLHPVRILTYLGMQK